MAITSNHVNNYSPILVAPLSQVGQVSSVTTTSIPIGQTYSTNTATWNGSHNQIVTINEAPAALEVRGRLTINGRDLEERLNTIEKVLEIPERDVKLERKHPKLRKLYEEYIHALAKYRTFDAIKGEDK